MLNLSESQRSTMNFVTPEYIEATLDTTLEKTILILYFKGCHVAEIARYCGCSYETAIDILQYCEAHLEATFGHKLSAVRKF